jgi:hypothetical protein
MVVRVRGMRGTTPWERADEGRGQLRVAVSSTWVPALRSSSDRPTGTISPGKTLTALRRCNYGEVTPLHLVADDQQLGMKHKM